MTPMHPIAARFHDEPALVSEQNHSLFASLLNAVVGFDGLDRLDAEAAAGDGFWPEEGSWLNAYRPYTIVNGILQIPVRGVLLHDFPYALGSWATGYEYIQRAFERGCEDFAAGNVKGIALLIDSPGGMVAGCFDAADKMIAAKTEAGVPVRSYAAEHAYSAAYAIAVIGDSITVSRTGGVGSIGVVTMHVDYSAAMEQAGIKVTFIHAGKHKVDGNAYEALPDDVKARIQSRIDELYGIFAAHVAANRPLDDAAVRATEALCFTATEARSNGLADDIGALDDALAAFAVDLSNTPEGDDEMSNQDKSAENAAAETNTVDVAQVAADAVAADRQRRRDIMGCDEAKERPALAAHLADATDMTVEQARATLGAAAVETKTEAKSDPATPFAETMDNQDHPGVGAEGGSSTEKDEDSADDVLALVRGLGIKGFKPATGNA